MHVQDLFWANSVGVHFPRAPSLHAVKISSSWCERGGTWLVPILSSLHREGIFYREVFPAWCDCYLKPLLPLADHLFGRPKPRGYRKCRLLVFVISWNFPFVLLCALQTVKCNICLPADRWRAQPQQALLHPGSWGSSHYSQSLMHKQGW